MTTTHDEAAQYLAATDQRYDPQARLIRVMTGNIGYHTQLPPGIEVHPIRESLAYAVRLLATGDPQRRGRACDILDRVLTLQVTDPAEATFGIWSWYLEEPLDQMHPPDWNWADFCGLSLAEVLAYHRDAIDDQLRARVATALGNAAWAIFRRNVGPGYTNIAIMGGGVCVAAGELLDDPRLLDYGRRRLQRCVDHFQWTGGFNEYNSPAYGMVVLHDTERLLALLRDEPGRQAVAALLEAVWETAAMSYHVTTGQWAGPHSRAYDDVLKPQVRNELLDRVAAATSTDAAAATSLRPPALPSPAHLVARMTHPPDAPREIRRRFIRTPDDARSTLGVTWMSRDACLGSVNFDNLWVQRRPVLGYFRTSVDQSPAILRLRILRDNKDFASGGIRSQQVGPRVLSGITLLTDRGDYHHHLDTPADGVFHIRDLRVRYELRGPEVRLISRDDKHLRLTAGGQQITLILGPAMFDGTPVQWEIAQDDQGVHADAVFHHNQLLPLDFRKLGPTYALAAAAITDTAEPTQSDPQPIAVVTPDEDSPSTATWAGLTIQIPTRPHRYQAWCPDIAAPSPAR